MRHESFSAGAECFGLNLKCPLNVSFVWKVTGYEGTTPALLFGGGDQGGGGSQDCRRLGRMYSYPCLISLLSGCHGLSLFLCCALLLSFLPWSHTTMDWNHESKSISLLSCVCRVLNLSDGEEIKTGANTVGHKSGSWFPSNQRKKCVLLLHRQPNTLSPASLQVGQIFQPCVPPSQSSPDSEFCFEAWNGKESCVM